MTKRVFLMAAVLLSASSALAYTVVGRYDHGSEVQIDLKCNNGHKEILTYHKKSGNYCTVLMTCEPNMDKVAKQACGEVRW